ncbi:hypothetical protein ACHHYP_20295 [Achlya hypogyna]|uniref:Uncharacterized protein n=1 Tax=Achlya hypogyna TaxID=1202772 RepID=A0A1V9YSN3_ACHHY|nr:hypothetical protein ACHHYP_20295 [Achlya hypogyna]
MLHPIEVIETAVDRHLVGKESMAAIARSSPIGLTQLKHYVKTRKEKGVIVVGKHTRDIGMHYGIAIVRLQPNATHLLQALDIAVFRPFKGMIARLMTQELRATNAKALSRRAAVKIAGGVAYN